MDKVLSIVIPSYNAEKFLDNILGNLLICQSLDQLDILIIDDGSTDKTALVANKYVTEYPASIRLISKKNGGHGSTINMGIKYATGRYFKVVDADDWLDSVNLDQFVKILEDEDSDLILTPFWAFNDKTQNKHLKEIKPEDIEWKYQYYLQNQKIEPVPSMHTYTLKTELLQQHQIKIDEHAYYVDIEYILYPIPYVKTFKFIDLPLYNYRVNQAGQSISLKNMYKNKQQHDLVVSHVNDYIAGHLDILNENQKELMINRLSRMIATQLKIITLAPIGIKTKTELKKFYQHVQKDYFFEAEDVNLPIRLLIKSHFYLFPAIHYLAIWKMNLIHF